MKPIYEPSGAAKEYGDLAINIYTGCPHLCYYCFAPGFLRRDKEKFHSVVEPRENIVVEVKKQIKRENITGKCIHLCFTCDPYPLGHDSSTTREIIRIIKETGNNVQILTKNGKDAMRDFDLLDERDWFGVTYAGYEPRTWDAGYIPETESGSGAPYYRINALYTAHQRGIKTWCSCEPVLDAADVINFIQYADYVDMWKIGKLNYYPSNIDWAEFGKQVERVCIAGRRNYCIKDSLRKEMEKIVVVYNVCFPVSLRHIVTYYGYTCEEDFWNWYYADYTPLEGDKIAVFDTQAEANKFTKTLN